MQIFSPFIYSFYNLIGDDWLTISEIIAVWWHAGFGKLIYHRNVIDCNFLLRISFFLFFSFSILYNRDVYISM